MPFTNSPDNMAALRRLGETLVSGRQQDARLRLQMAIAQAAQARQARQDALQANLWEAQSGHARSQTALDEAKIREIEQMLSDVNTFGTEVAGAPPTGPLSPGALAVAGRLAAQGRTSIPENFAQLRSLSDPRLSAMMATGSKIGPVPPGYTQVDPATGQPAFVAQGTPRRQFGAVINFIQALQAQASPVLAKLSELDPELDKEQIANLKALQEQMKALNPVVQQLLMEEYPNLDVPPGAFPAPEGYVPRPVQPPTNAVPTINFPPGVAPLIPRETGTNAVPGRIQVPPPTVGAGADRLIYDERTGEFIPAR